jgi:hypothetical protein
LGLELAGDVSPKILLVGATGTFGRRLLRNLLRVEGVYVLAASRNKGRADALVREVAAETAASAAEGVAFDRDHNAAAQLAAIKPWLVIDASGPFQGAGYGFARAIVAAGAHYIDLADGTDFLTGFAAAMNGASLAAGRVALSGASSTPALSVAVVEKLTTGWRRIDSVDVAIVPDGVGEVGDSVARAVLSYAGESVPQFREGQQQTATGWSGGEAIHVPGLGRRRVAPVDTVDAVLMTERFKVTSRVRFLAGLQSGLEMGGVRLLSWLRAQRFVPKLTPLAKVLPLGRHLTRLMATDRGGMRVAATGIDETGAWQQVEWCLVAREGCGPNIPGLPAVAAVRALLAGNFAPGAKLATEIGLAAIEREFAAFPITTDVTQKAGVNVFERVVGTTLKTLPDAVQQFHHTSAAVTWTGLARVTRGEGIVSRVVARLMGLPDATVSVAVRVHVERGPDGSERWTREFDGKVFSSLLTRGGDGRVWERFGPLNFALGLQVEEGKLVYPILGGTAFGIPIPRFLLPTSHAFEDADTKGRFRFDVKLGLPWFGLLVHYQGWLVAEQ